jgi:hypothetical protein
MPNQHQPKDITADSRTTALLVLDLNASCEDPKGALPSDDPVCIQVS